MKISDIISENKVREVVRPKHIHALINNVPPPKTDKVKFYAGQIEKEYDNCLHHLKTPTHDMKVAYSKNQIQVIIQAKWMNIGGPDGEPYCLIRIGLGDQIARFPIRFKSYIRNEIIEKYSEIGWKVEINDEQTRFYHPLDTDNNLAENYNPIISDIATQLYNYYGVVSNNRQNIDKHIIGICNHFNIECSPEILQAIKNKLLNFNEINEERSMHIAKILSNEIMRNHKDLMKIYGVDPVQNAVDKVSISAGDVDKISNLDIKNWMAQVENELHHHYLGEAEIKRISELSGIKS